MMLWQPLRLLLFWSVLYLQTPDGSAVAASRGVSQTKGSPAFQEEKQNTMQMKPKITVNIILGNATELQCRNEATEGQVMRWQTPFGSFEGSYTFSGTDPMEMRNGNLRITNVTVSHTGLYSCHHVDNRGATVIPYRVNVLDENTQNTRRRIRTAREAETSIIGYTDAHFAAAVSSSVLVTFIGAFTLGAFSQPYVVKCLQRIKARICPNKSSHRETTRASSHNLNSTVFFRRNANSEAGTVEIVTESSGSFTAPSQVEINQENQEAGAELEDDSVSSDADNGITTNQDDDDDDDTESDQPKDRGKKEDGGRGSERITRKQAKRVSRVIKLYNYDEDGSRFSHVKELEDNPTPRQRVMSLTRLQNIMSEMETADFSSSKDSTEPEEAPTSQLNET